MASPLTAPYQVGIAVPGGSPLVVGHATGTPEVSLMSLGGVGSTVNVQATGGSFTSGVAVGRDTAGVRELSLQLEVWCPGDAGAAMDLWCDLDAAFAAVGDPAVLGTLWVWLPGTKFGHREMRGRPRGISDDGFESLPHGLLVVTARFDVVDGTLGTQL